MTNMATSGEIAAFRSKAKEKIGAKDSRTGSHQSSRQSEREGKDPTRQSRESGLSGDVSEDNVASNQLNEK